MRTDRNRGKFWLRTSLVMVSVILFQLFLPWWGMLLGCLLCGYFTVPLSRSAFLTGFSGVFLTWGILALYLDLQNDSILSTKVIQLFPLPKFPIALVLITALMGGLAGGLACKTGDLFRRFFWKEKARYY